MVTRKKKCKFAVPRYPDSRPRKKKEGNIWNAYIAIGAGPSRAPASGAGPGVADRLRAFGWARLAEGPRARFEALGCTTIEPTNKGEPILSTRSVQSVYPASCLVIVSDALETVDRHPISAHRLRLVVHRHESSVDFHRCDFSNTTPEVAIELWRPLHGGTPVTQRVDLPPALSMPQ
eukprot:COSAG06_NODE_16979_length_969_cov_1.504598_2_plen_177_part_01